jgi:nucleotide-binding universal stress UspA family protein
MFRTIIVPLDGTEAAEAAVPYAAEETRHHGAQLVLLQVVPQAEQPPDHVVRGGPMPIVYVYPEDESDVLRTAARQYLVSVVDRYQLGMRTVISVDIGDPYLRLMAAIEQYPTPLVVVATPGPSGERPIALPIPLIEFLREGPVPVLVVRGARPIRRFAEVPVAAGVSQSLVDETLQWENLTVVDARVAGSN